MIFERSGPSSRPPISSSCTSIDSRYVEELENDFFDLEDKYTCMEKEKEQMVTDLEEKRRQQELLVEQVTDYKNRIASLEKRCAHLEDEIKNYRERMKLPESEQGSFEEGSVGGGAAGEGREELQQRVEEMEQLCQDLLEENEVLKEEVEEMQREIEEMHDHFQDEDTDTLRELQRELEAANKTCRIFQFKLRKAERRYEQCELERVQLEEKLHRLEHQFYSNDDRAQIRELEDELRMAKEVSVRLHDELEFLEEKRSRYESENSRLKDELGTCDRQRVQLENEMGRLKLEMDKLKTESGISDRGPLQVGDRSSPRSRLSAKPLSREPSLEEQSLSRELESSKERETDLLEQVRFAEEQVRTLKRKLADVEEENESLTKKCQKLVASRTAAAKKTNRRQDDDSSSDSSSDSDDANARLQMRFLEQEATVLRKRVISLERENDQLQRSISLKAATSGPPPPPPPAKRASNEAPAVLQTARPPRPAIVVDGPAEGGPGQSAAAAKAGEEVVKALRADTRRLDRELRRFGTEFARASADADAKRRTLTEKVTELEACCRDQDQQVQRLQTRMTELKSENEALQADKRRLEDRVKRNTERGRTKLDLKNATKEDLIEEVDSLDDELDDMYELVKKGDAKVARLEEQVSKFDGDVEAMYSDFAKRERELLDYIETLSQKYEVVCNLLEVVSDRAEHAQEQLNALTGGSLDDDEEEDKASSDGKSSQKDATNRSSSVSALSGASIGSDDVFRQQQQEEQKLWDERLKARVASLEKLLKEERQRTRVAEKNLEAATKEKPEGVTDSFKDNKALEKLKKELEEKEQVIDEKEEAMKDLRNRLEQSRRMYDAVKLLVDKGDDDSEKTRKTDVDRSSQIETTSYKLELNELKKKLNAVTSKLEEAEKTNEKLKKEHVMLMEDVKVREDTIFEQDDEIERKNDEIRNLKFYIEEEKSEMARIRDEMSNLQEQMQSVKQADGQLSQIEQEFERMKLSLEAKDEEIDLMKHRLQEKELELGQTEEQAKILADSVRNRDDRIKEKDELIQHINCRLQNREREMADTDNMLKQTTEKLLGAESEIKAARMKVGNAERDLKLLQTKVDDLKGAQEKQLREIADLKEENRRLSDEHDRTRQARDKEVAALREEMQRCTSAAGPGEADSGLKTELEAVRRERDEFRAKAQQQRDLKEAPSVEARLQGRVKLLNEEVGRLNLAQVSLKIQNEALQRDAMEYRQSFYQLKEQYQAEQDAWETEKCYLESKSKSKDEQRAAVVSLRKSLQEATQKVSQLEQKVSEQTQEYERAQMVMDREKMEIQARLNQYEEQQKVPKVLQKFRGKTPALEAAWEKERNEYKVRLNSHEKTVLKLRAHVAELEKKCSEERRDRTNNTEDKAMTLEKENESMKQACVELEHLRQHCTALRDRVRHLEGLQDRERRIWQDERSQLQYRGEEGKVMIDHWLNRLKIAVNDVPKDGDPTMKDLKDVLDTLKNILDEMEKFKKTRDRSPYVHIRRRWPDASGSHDHMGGSVSDIPGSPITTSGLCASAAGLATPASMSAAGIASQLPLSNRSVSMDWSHQGRLRSASPEPSTIAVRKLTNFPDPTPGFLVRSRQTSTDSLQEGDYTQRSFTVPHNFQRASSVSGSQTPREKFLDDYDKRVQGSTDQLAHRLTARATTPGSITNAKTTPATTSTTNSTNTGVKTSSELKKLTPTTTTTTTTSASSSSSASSAAATPSTTAAAGQAAQRKPSLGPTPTASSNKFGLSVLERRKLFSNKSVSLDSTGSGTSNSGKKK